MVVSPAPTLESAISPKSLGFFVLETRNWVLGVLITTGMLLHVYFLFLQADEWLNLLHLRPVRISVGGTWTLDC